MLSRMKKTIPLILLGILVLNGFGTGAILPITSSVHQSFRVNEYENFADATINMAPFKASYY